MSPLPLAVIGERINPGFRSSKKLLDDEDLPGLQELACKQVAAGAAVLNINVGPRCERDPAFMCAVIEAVQAAVAVPLSFDSPDPSVQAACLKAYDAARAGGKPIINSVTEHRWDMSELRHIQDFGMLLMASERLEDGAILANTTAPQVHATARRMVARACAAGWVPDDLIIDVSIGPMASDTEGLTRRALESIRLIGADPALAGTHRSVGLSNLSIMLPRIANDGAALGIRLENAFLSRAVPAGLDMVLGTPWRAYAWLDEQDLVSQGFAAFCAEEDGYDAIETLQELYDAVA